LLLLLFMAASHFLSRLAPHQTFDKNAAEIRELDALCQHIRGYQAKHRDLSNQIDNSHLMALLKPDYDKAIRENQEFLGTTGVIENGVSTYEIIDQWGTPVRISLIDPMNPVAHSAGPDMKWDTPDDLFGK
jgi:hypothetical protein